MAKEIERKYLPCSSDWQGLARGELLVQGYLAANADCAIRVRIAGTSAWLGIKGKTCGATRSEFEYPIPLADAGAMLEELAQKPVIEKTRYKIPFAGKVWEVDEFHGENQGLVIIEVELEDEQESVQKPHWVGQEVTGEAAYYNAALVSNPFSRWK